MKKIVCELCEGTEFTKVDGMFVCSGCGTKYSAEEAKSMMREVEGSAMPVSGTHVVSAGNPNQAQLDNILMLATNAYSASNNEETEKYCNRAIELDATCYKAWVLKGKAIGWSSTIQNQRLAEAAHSFKQAVEFAPDDEKEKIIEETTEELKRLGLACLSLRKDRFSKYPDKEELNGFVSDLENLIDGLVTLQPKQVESDTDKLLAGLMKGLGATGNFILKIGKAKKAGVPSEYFSQMANMMESASVGGFNNASREYNSENRPMEHEFKKCMNKIDNCIELMSMAIGASDDDDEADIKRFKDKIKMMEYIINMTAYFDYSSYSRTLSLTDEAKNNRRKNIKDQEEQIRKRQIAIKEKEEEKRKKAEEEKKARIEAYWAEPEHAEEKQQLEAEKTTLSDKVNTLNEEISKLISKIEDARNKGKEKTPSEVELDKIQDQIHELSNERAKLGLFKGGRKKEINSEIETLEGRVSTLKDKATKERDAKSAEIDKEVSPINTKKSELETEKSDLQKKISEINKRLTEDPAEK